MDFGCKTHNAAMAIIILNSILGIMICMPSYFA